jgi:hypothetical protein
MWRRRRLKIYCVEDESGNVIDGVGKMLFELIPRE